MIFKINAYNEDVLKLNMHSFLLSQLSQIIDLTSKDLNVYVKAQDSCTRLPAILEIRQ